MNTRENTPLLLTGIGLDSLGGYFKGLGVLRAVAQHHSEPRGRWTAAGVFELDSSLITQDALVDFFLDRWVPSPFFTPWNKDAGFLRAGGGGAIGKALRRIELATSPAFFQAQYGLLELRKILASLSDGWENDETAFPYLRSRLPEMTLRSFDAVLCLEVRDPPSEVATLSAPLFVSGGCDARADFSSAYNQRLLEILPTGSWSPTQRQNSESWLRETLFGTPSGLRYARTGGHFYPASSERLNSGQGPSQPSARTFTNDPHNSPWDYVLTLEGLLLFTGAASRRLGSRASKLAAFPFAAPSRFSKDREVWLPIWDRFTSVQEMAVAISRGRAAVSHRAAQSRTDFARAIAGYGVDRGFGKFLCFRIGAPDGRTHISVPEGEFRVGGAPTLARLLDGLDSWLGQRDLPYHLKFGVEQVIEEALSRPGDSAIIQELLATIGQADLAVCRNSEWRKRVRPVPWLNPTWEQLAYDDTPEFEIAAAVASLLADQAIPTFRCHVGAVLRRGEDLRWSGERLVECWGGANLERDLAEVLRRRYILIGKGDPFRSARPASLRAVIPFLSDQVDAKRLANLILGLHLVDWSAAGPIPVQRTRSGAIPEALYATLKVLLFPRCVGAIDGTQRFPGPVAALLAGYPDRALVVAQSRLRSLGRRPVDFHVTSSVGGERLAASLVIPISWTELRKLAFRVAPPR